jgi:hypothetical protein
LEDGITPDQADQGEVAVQAGPAAALVIAQPQLLFPILMEPLDHPTPMRQHRLLGQRVPIEPPGEIPFRVARGIWQGPLADQPADRAGHLPMGPVDAHPTR